MGRVAGLKRIGGELVAEVLVRVWARRSPPTVLPEKPSTAPSDSLQRAMNLIMPLHVPNIVARGTLARVLFEATDEVLAGLNNVGTIHFARFDLVAGNLCMFSIYDGELEGYIRDFIASIGAVFDSIVSLVKDPPPTPVSHHVDDFIAWVQAHDAFQMPESPVDLIPDGGDLTTLSRDTLIALHRNPNVQLGVYRGYPGFSAAQIRQQLSIGW